MRSVPEKAYATQGPIFQFGRPMTGLPVTFLHLEICFVVIRITKYKKKGFLIIGIDNE